MEILKQKTHTIQDCKVMLDFDLAALYEVETRVLNQAVSRNSSRFPDDFMFRLSQNEWESMSSQFVMTSSSRRPKKALPYAFTEQGIAMLSSVLRSERAVQTNILIMRTFVLIRHYALSHKELSEKLRELEGKFADVYQTLGYFLDKNRLENGQADRKRIGY